MLVMSPWHIVFT